MRLIAKIRLIFVVASLMIGGLFWIAHNVQMKQFQQKLIDRFMQVAPFCRTQGIGTSNTQLMNQYLVNSGFQPSGTLRQAPPKPEQAKVIYAHTMAMGTATVLKDGSDYYLHFQSAMGEQWLKSTEKPPRASSLLIWYAVTLVALWLLYLWLARSLAPLDTLHNAVEQIKNGDLSVSTKQARNDEIARVANTLDDALRRIESLIHSRQLFLHAIMHELKTPIAKGKLLNAFLEDGEQKEHYEALFGRLDLLLGEFARIEQMLTANYTLRIAEYSVENLVEHALELMLLSPDEIQNHIHQTIDPQAYFKTDFHLFTLAIKNIIDNALSHSSDNRAIIESDRSGIINISNKGEPLKYALQEYREPFTASSGGLGLGLYIVLNIVEVIGLRLAYLHEDGINTFTLQDTDLA